MARCFRPLTTAIWPLLALAVACEQVTALPPGSQSFVPPPEYRLWWSMTEECSGLHGSFSSVDWYVVPGTTDLPGTNGEYQGEWFVQGNRISLASAVQFEGSLVRHEMLHALIGADGHPRSEFLDRCAGTVVCEEECMRDAAPFQDPPAETPVVSASTLQIDAKLAPDPASAAEYDGYFAIVITAHNPADHAVIVRLPPYGDDNLGVGFLYLLGTDTTNGAGTFALAYDRQETFFRPGETKRHVFDLRIGEVQDGNLPPGDYLMQGSFGGHDGPYRAITLSP